MRVLHRFHGGIQPPENKAQSTRLPIAQAGLPPQLVLPLRQHAGQPAEPLVEVGDHVLKGQLLAQPRGELSAAVHAPTSGRILALEPRPIPHPSGMADDCLVLEPDGEERWGPRHSIPDWQEKSPSALLQQLRQAGIVGLGGAGFPTAVKLAPRQPIDTLLINGVECEPYITADDMLMRERAEAVLLGVRILRHIVQPRRETLIAIEDNKAEAIAAMRAAIGDEDGLEVVVIPTRYPSGGEKQLIEILTGQQVPSGGLPADLGILCQNVGTAAAVERALIHGEPLLSRITTVTGGACRQPRNFEVLLGTPVQWLLERAGLEPDRCSRLVLGGPMMGYTIEHADLPVVKSTNCILAPDHAEMPPPPPARACIRCGLCAEACPARLLPQQLYWFARGQEWDKLQQHGIMDCIECGACSYVCPSHIPLVQYYRAGKAELRRQESARLSAEHAKLRFEARQQRIAREEAEREARRRQRQQAAREREKAGEDPIQAAVARAEARRAQRQAAPGPEPATAPNTEADAARSAIERAQAQRAAADQATPREHAQQQIERLSERLERSRTRLEQARREESEHAELLAATVQRLEQQLEAARHEQIES